MKLQAKIEGEKLDVEIVRSGNRITAKIGDHEYMLEVSQPEPNIYALKNGNLRTEAFVTPNPTSGKTTVAIRGNEFEIELIDLKRLRGATNIDEETAGAAEIKTAMPGKVVRVLVKVGADVLKGDGVIVVEAMKMQNEMKSPKDGVIREIRADEGDTVNAGDVLVVVD